MNFEKPATSIDDQLKLLRKRGMQVPDSAEAKHYLSHISYYRLRAYWLLFEGRQLSNGEHLFKEGTEFSDVASLYIFDRKLRLHILDAIERIEVSVRAHWAHHMALTYGAHGYSDRSLYYNHSHFEESLTKLKDSIGRSTDAFIQHYQSKYTSPVLPPIWMVVELLSLGQLSMWYKNLGSRKDRQAIAKPFGIDEKVLTSFLQHAAYVRNICAHHGRLWNKQFTVTMMEAKSPASLSLALKDATNTRRIYHTLVTISYLLRIVAPQSTWQAELVDLIVSNPIAKTEEMGFPANWQTRPFWKNSCV